MKRAAIIFLLFFFTILTARGVDSAKKVEAVKADKVNVDGILNENVWKLTTVENFIQRDPAEGSPATESTKVWIAYDKNYIYIAAKLYDSHPELIDKSLSRRDSNVDSDWFIFYVDPYFDKKTGYYFGVNPGGSIMDGTIYNDGWDDDSWDGIWKAKTSIDNEGWNVEVRIPFSQLRFNETEKMEWGINFSRTIKRKNEESYFVMVPKKESGFVSHFATLEGLNNIHVKQRVEVLPYIVRKASYLKHDSGDPFYKSNQYKTNIGADLKFSIGSNLNVDATLNPDFGQVEVDPAVVNLSAFETYFPEKRPFFIEGRDIFQFGYGGANNNWGFNFGIPTIFYSRRIGRSPQGETSDADFIDRPRETRILGAAKLTGKLDETWSIGALSSVTERTYAELNSNGKNSFEEIEPATHYGVFRTQKEFNDGKQGLGMIFTTVNRNLRTDNLESSISKDAYTFGTDGWTFLDENETYVLNGTFLGSYVHGSKEAMINIQERPYRYFQRPDAEKFKLDSNRTSLSGAYGRVMLNKQKGNWYVNSAIGFVTPGFEYNDLGLQYWSDKINGHIVGGYRWYEPDGIFRKKWLYLAHFRDYDFEGDILRNGVMTFINLQFMNYYSLNMNASYNWKSLSKGITRGGVMALNPNYFYANAYINSDSRKDIIVSFGGGFFRDGLRSHQWDVSLDLEIKPGSQLNITVGPSFSKSVENHQFVTNVDDPFASATLGVRSVFAKLDQEALSANIRLNWTFTPALSLQLFLQPLFVVGNYDAFNELSRPKSLDYAYYGENGSSINYNSADETYTIDPDGSGKSEKFEISNPDFNFKSLRSNLVLRWEVLPGSIFYLVWTHDKMNFQNPGEFEMSRDFRNLMLEKPDNIFLMKFSYWFDI